MTCRSHPTKVVVAKRWTGLGDCIVSLMAAYRYARATGRTLVADWRHSVYGTGRRNLFSTVFEPPSEILGVPFVGDDRVGDLFWWAAQEAADDGAHAYWPPPWTNDTVHEPARFGERGDSDVQTAHLVSCQDVDATFVIFDRCLYDHMPTPPECHRFLSALVPRCTIRERVAEFTAAHFLDRPVIGIHVRHGNGGNIMGHTKYWTSPETALAKVVTSVHMIAERVARHTGGDPVLFLCTDSVLVEDILRAKLRSLLTRAKLFRELGTGELHGWRHAESTLLDAATEMMLLAEVDVLVRFPPESFFSYWGAMLKRESPVPLPDPIAELAPRFA